MKKQKATMKGVQELVPKRDPRSPEQRREIPRGGRGYLATGQKRVALLVGGGRRSVMKENLNVCSQFLHLSFLWGLIFRFRFAVFPRAAVLLPQILPIPNQFMPCAVRLTTTITGSNCKRGGFVCEGYSGKINWQKPPGKSGNSGTTPVSIQSKTEQPESTSASPTPIHVVVASVPKQLHHRPEEVRRAPYQPAVVKIDEAKPSLEEPISPNLVTRQQLPHPYPSEQPIQTPTHQAYVPAPQQAPSPLLPASAPVTNHNASSLAAISAASGSTLPRQRSEKEKMIKSELYHANAPELVEERERCKAACWRFNNAATNPNLGISKIEKGRLLLDVLRPRANWEVALRSTEPGKPLQTTYVDERGYPTDIIDVQVDAPFTCSYGYNIRLGKDVNIEFGCTILDSCAVSSKTSLLTGSSWF
jgi:hypothetical protein